MATNMASSSCKKYYISRDTDTIEPHILQNDNVEQDQKTLRRQQHGNETSNQQVSNPQQANNDPQPPTQHPALAFPFDCLSSEKMPLGRLGNMFFWVNAAERENFIKEIARSRRQQWDYLTCLVAHECGGPAFHMVLKKALMANIRNAIHPTWWHIPPGHSMNGLLPADEKQVLTELNGHLKEKWNRRAAEIDLNTMKKKAMKGMRSCEDLIARFLAFHVVLFLGGDRKSVFVLNTEQLVESLNHVFGVRNKRIEHISAVAHGIANIKQRYVSLDPIQDALIAIIAASTDAALGPTASSSEWSARFVVESEGARARLAAQDSIGSSRAYGFDNMVKEFGLKTLWNTTGTAKRIQASVAAAQSAGKNQLKRSRGDTEDDREETLISRRQRMEGQH